MNTQQTLRKGFTIIEVVLVLAIAGLIFLMVFVALPALQSGQRDTARKNDVGSVVSAVNTYSSNSRGGFPANAAALGAYNTSTGKWDKYMTAVSSNIQTLDVKTAYVGSVTATDATATVVPKAICPTAPPSGAGVTLSPGTARQYVVVTLLESGGGTAFCQNS